MTSVDPDLPVYQFLFKQEVMTTVTTYVVQTDIGTDLNIILGLCLGHDITFSMHSKAPVTTLIVKDRRTGNNPAAALYNAYPPYNFYYGRLLKSTSETGGR